MLGQLGLNHMNGRIEDAVSGTFLSPDPNVTDPANSQDYYRYAYVYNNPMTNVDPTGFEPCGVETGLGGGYNGCLTDPSDPCYGIAACSEPGTNGCPAGSPVGCLPPVIVPQGLPPAAAVDRSVSSTSNFTHA